MWCDISFPEPTKDSQVKTYREVEHPCTECSLPFKHCHDMLKYLRSHIAKEYPCDHCNYTGTKINPKAHQTQHDPCHIYM